MLNDPLLVALRDGYIDSFLKCEPGKRFDDRQWPIAGHQGQITVRVLRGDVLEKACVSEISAAVMLPGRDYETSIQWLSIQTFPSNPLVPMFMAIFEHMAVKGKTQYPCFFDVYPAVPCEEDRLMLHREIGMVCARHGLAYPNLPEGYCRMFKVQEAGIGVGYCAGIALGPEETNIALYTDCAHTIRNAYFSMVAKGKDKAFSQRHIEEMFRFRADWVKYTFRDNRFLQGAVSLGIPIEGFMLHMLPPTVRF